nr:uncharacterized protein LOC127295293 [Lolium perenne]
MATATATDQCVTRPWRISAGGVTSRRWEPGRWVPMSAGGGAGNPCRWQECPREMVLGDPLSGANSLLFYGGPADEIQQQKTALTTRPFRSILPTAHPYFQIPTHDITARWRST